MTILLMCTILIMIFEIKGLTKDLFVSVETRKESFIKIIKELEEKSQKDLFIGMIVLICIFYVCFYIMSMLYISTFMFSVASILLIISTLINTYNAILYASNPEIAKPRTFVKRVLNFGIDYIYLLYVLYWIYLNY